jgi:hypothetical protein
MRECSKTEPLDVDTTTFVRIDGRPGTVLSCVAGCLWITEDGSLRDIRLSPGQNHVVTKAARITVCGFGPSCLQVVQRPQAMAWPAIRRAIATWAGAEAESAIEPPAAAAV